MFPRKQNINTELDAGGRRARAGAGWKMKMLFIVDSCGTMDLSPGCCRKGRKGWWWMSHWFLCDGLA